MISFFKRLFGGDPAPQDVVELKTQQGNVLRVPWSDYEATLRRKLANHPGDVTVLRGVAEAFVQYGKHEAARPLLAELTAHKDAEDEDFTLAARSLVALGRATDAEPLLRRRLEHRGSKSLVIRGALTRLLEARGDADGARALALESARLDPNAPDALRALYALEQGRAGAAAAEALVRQIAGESGRSGAPFLVLGQYAEHHDPTRAAALFEEGLARDPRYEPLLAALSANLGARGLYDEVIKRFDPMINEGYLMDFDVYANVAEAHFAKGNRGRVIALYNERIHRGPEMHKIMAQQKLVEIKERVAAAAAAQARPTVKASGARNPLVAGSSQTLREPGDDGDGGSCGSG